MSSIEKILAGKIITEYKGTYTRLTINDENKAHKNETAKQDKATID